MEKLKQKIEGEELEARKTYENFAQKNRENEFLNDLTLLKFKAYQHKEFIKIFANNFNSEAFQGTRNSLYSLIFLPTIMMVGFNLLNPYSIFRRIAVFSAIGGSMISFYFNLKDELEEQARTNTVIGAQIRERYQQLATFDPVVRTFGEESRKYAERSRSKQQDDKEPNSFVNSFK